MNILLLSKNLKSRQQQAIMARIPKKKKKSNPELVGKKKKTGRLKTMEEAMSQ